MVSFIQDVTHFLEDYSKFVLRDDLFVGELKRGVDGVFVVASPSIEPDKETGIEYYSLDFWSRNIDTGDGFADLDIIYEFFDRRHHYRTDNWFIHFSHCGTQVQDMDRDQEGAKLLKLAVEFIVNKQNAIS